MAFLIGDKCPFCGVYVKQENLKRHFEHVHPKFSEDFLTIVSVSGECPICGKRKDVSTNRYKIPICNEHYVKDIRPFLVKDHYIKLKGDNDKVLSIQPDAAFWMLYLQLQGINALLGWEPENISEQQFLQFNEVSAFTGYALLRLLEAVPDFAEKMYFYAESEKPLVMPKKLEPIIGRLSVRMNAEFELFTGIKLGSNSYYDIAVDNELSPKSIILVPSLHAESIDGLLRLLLRDANEQWHGTFRKILVPTGESTAHDESGASFSFKRSLVKENFEVFKLCWKETFGNETKMSSEDFEKLWDWLDWVVSFQGITENNQNNATYFTDYVSFGLDKNLVFQTLNEVLPQAEDCLNIISLKGLAQPSSYLNTFFDMAQVARGFRLATRKGVVYFFPCRKWYYNKIMPVFLKMSRKLELAGSSFENNINKISSFYSKSGVTLGAKSTFGYMIEPRIVDEKKKAVTSRSVSWQVLERNFQMQLDDDPFNIGKSGEIDLIVYANMSIYLIELKALNLDDRFAIKYLKEKAPIQCARYSSWVKNKNQFKAFLEKHRVNLDQLKSVRIVICSSGGFKELDVPCSKTGESFAVVSEFALFSTMAGYFSLSLKNPFPERVGLISTGLRISSETIPRIGIFDNGKELREEIARKLLHWRELITYDRRKPFEDIKTSESMAKGISFINTGYLQQEVYIAETSNWILPKPFMLGSSKNYNFYVGTQISGSGSTIICSTCHSAIKYFYSDDEEINLKIQDIFSSSRCPICEGPLRKTEEMVDIKMTMSFLVNQFKAQSD